MLYNSIMNKIKILIIGILSIVAISSCKNKKVEGPEDVTKAYVIACYTADFDQMYKLTPSNNRPIIQQLQKQMNNHQDKWESMKKNEVEIIDVACTMLSDSTAECECHFKLNKSDRKIPYDLRMEDGKWLVDLRIN